MPKKIKIMFLQAFPLWGCGSGTYVRKLAEEISKEKNVKVAIVSPSEKTKKNSVKFYPLELPFPVAFTGHPKWPVCKLYKDLDPKDISNVMKSFLSSTIKAVEDFRPDIIHVHHLSLLAWVAYNIKGLYGIDFIATAHGTGILAAEEKRMYIPIIKDALAGAKKLVAVSNHTKKRMIDLFGEDLLRKSRIIPGGISLGKLPLKKKIKTINKKYKLKDKKVILFTGKLNEIKGVQYLVRAAPDIKGDVYIIGDGPLKKDLEEIIYKNKISNVHLLGYMGPESKDDLEEFYKRADIFIAPSIVDEALGFTILEAMAFKTPVVATRKGGIPLIVKNGKNGILIRSKSSKKIAEACNKLLENEEMRKRMGKEAYEIIKKKFTWEKIAKKYMKIYKEIYENK